MPMGEFPAENNTVHPLTWPTGPHNTGTTKLGWLIMTMGGQGQMATGHVRFITFQGQTPTLSAEQNWQMNSPGVVSIACPPDTVLTEVTVYESTGPIGWCLDLYAQ